MSVTRSITFNNFTATISLPTSPNNDNQLIWYLSLASGENTVSTYDILQIEMPVITETSPAPRRLQERLATLTQPPAPAPVPAAVPVPDTTAFVAVEEKNKHIAVIKALLDMCESLKGKESKAVAAIKVLDYVSGEALEFTKTFESFKSCVIKKCYEFKRVNSDIPAVVEKADAVLIKLGKCPCSRCSKLAEPTNTVVQPITEPVKPVPTAATGERYNPDMSLFLTMAREHELDQVLARPTEYWTYYENAVRLGSVRGATKTERMNNYLGQFSELGARTQLMKSLFEKKKLIFNDSVMSQYMEWVKTYKPSGKTNRFRNMCIFIDAHKSLFTA
jgi:hypothetical protein